MDATDLRILDVLRNDARMPVASLAGIVGLSRTTVHERLARLRQSGTVRFTVQTVNEMPRAPLAAYLIVYLDGPQCERVAKALAQMAEIRKCVSIGGEIDMILHVEAQDPLQLNDIRDKVEAVRGVRKVTTGIILTERFNRS